MMFPTAIGQALRQAEYHFKTPSTRDTIKLVAFACVADRWSWTSFGRDELPRTSDHADATFHLEDEEDDDLLPTVYSPHAPKNKGKKRARPSFSELGAESVWDDYLERYVYIIYAGV